MSSAGVREMLTPAALDALIVPALAGQVFSAVRQDISSGIRKPNINHQETTR